MRSRPVRSTGYTLVEVLIATTLALMLMAAVAQMFAQLGTSVNYSRATLETANRCGRPPCGCKWTSTA